MIYKEMPADFNPVMDVVACFCVRYDRKFLLLHRRLEKPQGGTWCLPGGKKKQKETIWEAIIRELFEETGAPVLLSRLHKVHVLYVRYKDMDFVYHVFETDYYPSNITISGKEHSEYRWVSPGEALIMNLIEDEAECIKLAYNIS